VWGASPNKSLHQTKPFVTHRACARSVPNSFAGETNVRLTGEDTLNRSAGILVLLACIAQAGSAYPSSFLIPTPEGRFEHSTVVFAGVIERFVDHRNYENIYVGRGTTEIVFRVGQVWKGPAVTEQSVICWGGCYPTHRLKEGECYLVYAWTFERQDSPLIVTDRLEIRPIEEAVLDRVVLPEPFVVAESLAVSRPSVGEVSVLLGSENGRVRHEAERALHILNTGESEVSSFER
jgi:hypothetical protein